MQKIAVIGNCGGGKTTLARLLSKANNLPLYHVDSIQLGPGRTLTPPEECDRKLDELLVKQKWIIDGLGSRDSIERRVRAADTVIFIDLPLLVHYYWAAKRQWKTRTQPRTELPADFNEFSLSFTYHLAINILRWNKRRRWFQKLIDSLPKNIDVFHIHNPKEWNAFAAWVQNQGKRPQLHRNQGGRPRFLGGLP